MHSKYFVVLATAVTVLLLSFTAVFAQTGELRGHVIFKQADGTTVKPAGAQVDVYRTDLPGNFPTKTDKRGEFVFAGLPYVGTYIIAVSLPNASPVYQSNVKVGRDIDYEIELSPGDGRKLSLDDIKKAMAGAPKGPASSGGGESATDKAKREELLKKNKEIEEKNKKNQAINDVLNRTFKAGNDAFLAKNYDESIKQYDEGIAADPEQSVLYTAKARALRFRGVDHYNLFVKSTDQAVKATELDSAKKDFQGSAENANKAVEIAQKEETPTDAAGQAAQKSRKVEALANRVESMRLLAKVDPTQADAGKAAYQEYIAVETDPKKKASAQMDLAQMLLDAGAADKAVVEFKKILDGDPDNVEALYGAGISQINVGYGANDKATLQEGVNYLQRFVDKAPDTNKYKAEAKSTIEVLKNEQKIEPEKTTKPPTRRRP